MPCKCIKCGRLVDCGEKLCPDCFLDTLNNVEKNLYLGGHFYKVKEDYELHRESQD